MHPYPTDDELAAALSALLARTDQVPPEVVAAASQSLGWRDPDAALAVLVAESTGALAGSALATVRGTPPRLLTFEVDGVTIDLEITVAGPRIRIVGQMAPMRPGTVSIAHANGTSATTADALGRFTAEDLPAGRLRVCVTPDEEGARTVCTEWFTS